MANALKKYFLKAGEGVQLSGTGHYFNLLSSSAGFVTIQALDGQGGVIEDALVNNGDSVELHQLASRVFMTMAEDGEAVVWLSKSKLVNSGVSVKSAGNIKTSIINVSGKKKLNTINGQNKQIKVKALAGDVQLSSSVGAGWPLAQGDKEEISSAGDVYAYKPPLVVQYEDVREALNDNGYATTSSATKIHGEKQSLYLVNVAGNHYAIENGGSRLITNTVTAFLDGESFVLNISSTSGSLVGSSCFMAGEFYFLWVRRTTAGNTAVFIAKSSDLKEFTLQIAQVIGQQMTGAASSFGGGYLTPSIGGGALAYESNASNSWGTNFILYIDVSAGRVSAYNESGDYGRYSWAAGEDEFYAVAYNRIRKLDRNGFAVGSSIAGISGTVFSKGNTGQVWKDFVIIPGTNSMYKINVSDGSQIALPNIAGNPQFNPVFINDDFYTINTGSKEFIKYNLNTNLAQARVIAFDTLSQGTYSGALFQSDTTGEALVTFIFIGRVLAGDVQKVRAIFNPLLIESGEVKSAQVAVMELF